LEDLEKFPFATKQDVHADAALGQSRQVATASGAFMPLALPPTSKPPIAGSTCRDIDMAAELTIGPFQTRDHSASKDPRISGRREDGASFTEVKLTPADWPDRRVPEAIELTLRTD
jgi:hypothetical protein